jgi:hypothetical protein
LPILVGEHPYPGEYGDPVGNGAFASRQAEAFPTAESVRIPVHVRLADGYETDGAELAHPVPFASWTRDEIVNVVEALLRTLCVREGDQYAVAVQWSNGEGVLVRLNSGSARAETAYVPFLSPPSRLSLGITNSHQKGSAFTRTYCAFGTQIATSREVDRHDPLKECQPHRCEPRRHFCGVTRLDGRFCVVRI